jgi:hypothetical protein
LTRQELTGKTELTPPPARLDQRSNPNPCSSHGPYEFLAKINQFHVVHATRPCRSAEKQAMAAQPKEEPPQQKARQMPGFSIYR